MRRHGPATRALTLVVLLSTLTSIACARPPATTALQAPLAGRPSSTAGSMEERYGRLPLPFEENHGQAPASARYVAHARGSHLLLGPDAIVFEARRERVRMILAGSRPGVGPEGLERLPGTVNYFTSRDSRDWVAGVPTYARVRYRDIYPGIDLIFHGNPRSLKYDFVVAPGADPARIALRFEGAEDVAPDGAGGLVVRTPRGRLVQAPPAIYQD